MRKEEEENTSKDIKHRHDKDASKSLCKDLPKKFQKWKNVLAFKIILLIQHSCCLLCWNLLSSEQRGIIHLPLNSTPDVFYTWKPDFPRNRIHILLLPMKHQQTVIRIKIRALFTQFSSKNPPPTHTHTIMLITSMLVFNIPRNLFLNTCNMYSASEGLSIKQVGDMFTKRRNPVHKK